MRYGGARETAVEEESNNHTPETPRLSTVTETLLTLPTTLSLNPLTPHSLSEPNNTGCHRQRNLRLDLHHKNDDRVLLENHST